MTKKIFGVDIDKLAKEILKNVKKDELERRLFYHSQTFKRLVDLIEQHSSIDQEALAYETQTIPGLTYEDFTKVCETLYSVKEDEVQRISKERETYCLEYRRIKVKLAIGQGSNFWTERI